MGLQLVTPPTDYPITLDQAKAHLNVVDADDDDKITQAIAAATQALDGPFGWLGRAIMPQTWDYFRDSFPGTTTNEWGGCGWTASNCGCATTSTCGGIELPLPPLVSVDAVYYADPDNPSSYLTLDAAEYAVDNAGYVGWVQPVDGWPSTATSINAVKIRFTAGFATVPADILQAIYMLTRDWYDQPGSYVVGVGLAECPRAVDALINGYRVLIV